MEPSIIFEDGEMVVVDKPSGMIVYPDGKHDYPALSSWLERKYKGVIGEQAFYFVHRIDRETSGVLVIAKTEKAHAFLKEQFQNREVQKTYRAFVYGTLPERGIIERPIGSARGGLAPRSARRPYGTTRDAVTVYKVLAYSGDSLKPQSLNLKASYVEVFPKTGRTHQIRVHFAAIEHPVVCDRLYAAKRPALLGFNRLALHALSISLGSPNGEKMTFTAPLPPDFVAAEKELRAP